MSLKAIHVLFITAATVMALFFGAWGLKNFFEPGGSAAHLVYAVIALGGGVALVVYGCKFLKKMKHISYL